MMVVMLYVRFPLSLRNVEDLAFERGIDICHETVRHWGNRFGPMFASKICSRRVQARGRHIAQESGSHLVPGDRGQGTGQA